MIQLIASKIEICSSHKEDNAYIRMINEERINKIIITFLWTRFF